MTAAIQLKAGRTALKAVARSADTDLLQAEVKQLRENLQRELIASGEVRSQAARHEAIARGALSRLEASEMRERKHLRELGTARERVIELEGITAQLKCVKPTVLSPPRSA